MKQPMNMIFLGGPGAGKGTQAAKVAKRCGIPHIATGDILKQARRNKSPMGLKAKEYMDRGDLVPDEVVIGIIEERLQEKDVNLGFILDGFPRTLAQGDALYSTLKKGGRIIDHVIYFKTDNEEIVKRLSGRRTCEGCGEPYHVVYNPPTNKGTCNKCNGTLYQREDDQEDTINVRLRVYQEQTAPLIAYYRERGLLREINAVGGIDEIFEKIISVLEG